jgi:hypothetical protein
LGLGAANGEALFTWPEGQPQSQHWVVMKIIVDSVDVEKTPEDRNWENIDIFVKDRAKVPKA